MANAALPLHSRMWQSPGLLHVLSGEQCARDEMVDAQPLHLSTYVPAS